MKHLDTDNTVASTDPSGIMVWIDEWSNELWVDRCLLRQSEEDCF